MILPFSTQLNGKPTYFVEKMLRGIDLNFSIYTENFWKESTYNRFDVPLLKPKVHTFREDKNDRWHKGTMIDFFINCRQKDMFRFAPVLPVVSTQKIEIIYYTDGESPIKKAVIIDDKKRLNGKEIKNLAMNDGFDTVNEFFAYFNLCFTGKIIHWTDLRY